MIQFKEDLKVFYDRDPAARSSIDIIINQPCIYAIWLYRISHWLWNKKLKTIARIITNISRLFTGVEIHPAATIGRRFFVDHGAGIVIGETVEIGDDCSLYQGSTLGGVAWKKGKRHPTLGNNVVVGAGAKVLGPIIIGNNARIGSNAVITKDIPDNVTMVGVPGRAVNKGTKNNIGFDQYAVVKNIVDPFDKKVKALEKRIASLEKELKEKNTN